MAITPSHITSHDPYSFVEKILRSKKAS